MAKDYQRELNAAVAAVRAAAGVCQAVQQHLVTADTLQKKDRSPVTVADFASQAVVCATLAQALPEDGIVGEEDARELRQADQATIRNSVIQHVQSIHADAGESQVLDWIDRGGAAASGPRYWTLDPIDGTKGFLRGEQYAVALALIENAQVVVGVMGCPNLPMPGSDRPGTLVTAVRDRGAFAQPLWDADAPPTPIRVSEAATAAGARFCESVESGHSNQSQSARIATRLGITAEPLRMDSQCKYAAVARGDASIYLRLPTSADYRENIWDHAAGLIAVEEAGGKVTDITGKNLDFAHGRRFEHNRGVVATNAAVHHDVIAAIAQVLT